MVFRVGFLSTALLVTSTFPAVSAPGIVGIAVSQGQLQVNNVQVDGNANLSNGATVRTWMASSRIHMANGSNLTLDRDSQVKILEDRIVLEQGTTQFASKNAYALEAMGFRVTPDAFTQVRVQAGRDRMMVSALDGGVRITDNKGLPIARLTAGRSLGLQPAAASSGISTMTGKVAKENGKFLLADEVSGLKVELNGDGLAREVGSRVNVSGTATASADRSTQVIQVAKLHRLEGDEPTPSPGPTPSPNPKPAAAQSGGAAIWVMLLAIGGVGGAAAAIALHETSP